MGTSGTGKRRSKLVAYNSSGAECEREDVDGLDFAGDALIHLLAVGHGRGVGSNSNGSVIRLQGVRRAVKQLSRAAMRTFTVAHSGEW